jgi:hypothetical protein
MFVASIEDCCSIEDKLIELSIMPLDPVDERVRLSSDLAGVCGCILMGFTGKPSCNFFT